MGRVARSVVLWGGLLVAALSLAAAIHWAVTARHPAFVFVGMAVSWGSYLCAHYAATGRLVDPRGQDDDPSIPTSWTGRALAGSFLGTMVLAFPIGIVAMSRASYPLLAVATGLFIGSYVTGHLLFTGKPL